MFRSLVLIRSYLPAIFLMYALGSFAISEAGAQQVDCAPQICSEECDPA